MDRGAREGRDHHGSRRARPLALNRRAPSAQTYGMRTPEMALAITRRWISEVPSKIV
jgi:hypothetical protein